MKKKLLLFLAFLFVARIALSFGPYHPDVGIHMDWGERFFDYGPKEFYSSDSNVWSFAWPNQPPGTVIMTVVIRKIHESVFSLFWNINTNVALFPSGVIPFLEAKLYPALIKFPAILADFGIAYLLYKFLLKKGKKKAIFAGVLFLLNPIVWYNSSIWGQTDSIVNFLVLFAIWGYQKKNFYITLISLAISLYIKLSMLIFIPIFVILFIKDKYKVSKLVLPTIFSLTLIARLTSFFAEKQPLFWLWEIYREKVLAEQLHLISANAFNFWAIFTGHLQHPNSLPLLGLTYEHWGIILFLFSILPVYYLAFKAKKAQKVIFWSFALTAFCAFMFLTNMHERYLYPLFPYLTIIVAQKGRLLKWYIAISLINFVNLYNLWWQPRIDPLVSFMTKYEDILFQLMGFASLAILVYFYQIFIKEFFTKKSYA